MFFIEVYCFQRFGVMMASDTEEIGWMQDILHRALCSTNGCSLKSHTFHRIFFIFFCIFALIDFLFSKSINIKRKENLSVRKYKENKENPMKCMAL